MTKKIGLSRAVKTEWLNKTVELILEGKDESQIKDELHEYLSFEIKSDSILKATRAILMNIWVRTSGEYAFLKQQALKAFENEKSDKLVLHWSMMLVTYPVFNDVCALIGKLTSIQGTFTTTWLHERLFELWGEGATLYHSNEKILQTLKLMGVIQNEKVGVYRVNKYPVVDDESIQVLLTALLNLKEKAYYEVTELSSVPQAFPFEYTVPPELLYNSDLFTVDNFGGKIVVSAN
jgi:hypothetical protein